MGYRDKRLNDIYDRTDGRIKPGEIDLQKQMYLKQYVNFGHTCLSSYLKSQIREYEYLFRRTFQKVY